MKMEIEQERFVQIRIKGCEAYYISNWHRVYSLKTAKLMKPYLHKSRSALYWRFSLNKIKIMGHNLVADHFLPPAIFGQTQVEHIDNNTLNNVAWNLMRCSQSQNINFRYKKAKIPDWLNQRAIDYERIQKLKI